MLDTAHTNGANHALEPSLSEAQTMLEELASVFLRDTPESSHVAASPDAARQLPNMEARYRSLVEQIPAVVFMVYLDRGIGEAYVSPHIEAALGFSQAEWLEDPVRWYQQIHPEDNQRWSKEAADMFLSGKPLRSAYRVIARDGRVVWFHCEAKMVRRDDGHPWFIHGVAFDITELKQSRRSAAAGAQVRLGDSGNGGRADHGAGSGRAHRAVQSRVRTDHRNAFGEVKGRHAWELFAAPEDRERFQNAFEQLRTGVHSAGFRVALAHWRSRPRLISWSGTLLPDAGERATSSLRESTSPSRKRLEKAMLEISAREQRRIGQDLHDGLGQHLTGIAFMSKVLEQKLAEKSDCRSRATPARSCGW